MKPRATLAPLLLAAALGGCASGQIRAPAGSADGAVIAYQDRACPRVYVADAGGPAYIGNAAIPGGYAVDPAGRWVLLLAEPSDEDLPLPPRRPTDRLVLHDVAARTSAELPAPDHDWPIALADAAVWFAGDTVTLGLPFGPPGHETATEYLRWTGDAWQSADRPAAGASAAFADPAAEPEAFPVVEFPSNGLAARRTVWVTPAGKTVELLRHNDAPAKLLKMMLLDVWVMWFNPYYYRALGREIAETLPHDQSAAKARLRELQGLRN